MLALRKLKWPNGPENLDRDTGEVIMRAGSQSQRFDLGIDSALFSVFYGGSGDEYAPQHDQKLTVRNLSFA